MGFKSLLPQAVTLLMAASESHERARLIGLAQMPQISEVIIMALAYKFGEPQSSQRHACTEMKYSKKCLGEWNRPEGTFHNQV